LLRKLALLTCYRQVFGTLWRDVPIGKTCR